MSRETWYLVIAAVVVVGAVTLFFALRLMFRLVAVKRALGQLGGGGKFAYWAALVYLISPVDLLPDPIYLDDMAVVGGALFFLGRLLRKQESIRNAIPVARRIATQAVRRRAARPRRAD
jgi:uncharacterized membrane protein YkvA (DUF1232 family)